MTNKSDGSTASYYELPHGCTELQDLISYRNLNAQDGEIFRAIYRKGRASHSDELRDARKVLFYARAEVKRLEALATVKQSLTVEPAMPADFGQQHAIEPAMTVDEAIELGAREPQQPRHRCLACSGGHATHECQSGT